MSLVTGQGMAAPFDPDGQPYPSFGSRTPALHSFRLTFPAPTDHEIALIQILAGGDSEDLSPTADLQPSQVPDGRLHVAFQDADPAGEQFGYRVSYSALSNVGARRFQIRDVGCQGKCVRRLNLPQDGPIGLPAPPPLLALAGFKLFFTGARDHELDRIGVWFRGMDLHVAFRDANGDDTFGYLVDFIAIPGNLAGLNVLTGVERGTASALDTISLPSFSHADFLLTGWAFNFRKDDQEILDIGVIRQSNSMTVFYGDSGGGEEFDWRVEWAQIAPQVVAPT
jgi:hypothetical protein